MSDVFSLMRLSRAGEAWPRGRMCWQKGSDSAEGSRGLGEANSCLESGNYNERKNFSKKETIYGVKTKV